MPFKGVDFHGTRIFLPDVYPHVDVSAFVLPGVGTGKVVGVIGTCTGGKPREIVEYDNLLDALHGLRTGPMAEEIARIFAPGPGSVGSPVIKSYRINDADQSSLTYNTKLVLTSIGYGKWTDKIRLSIADGTSSGKKVTLDVAQTNTVEVRDNLGDGINVQYIGGGDSAELTLGKLPTPAAPTVALAADVGALAEGANYVAIAYINEFGEEGKPSVASTLVTTNTINADLGVTVTLPTGAALPAGAATIAIYWGTTTTVANMLRVTAVAVGTASYVIIATPSGSAAAPQTSNQSRPMFRTRVVNGAAGEELDYDLTSIGLNTIIELAIVLNGLASYTSNLLSRDSDMPSSYLDEVSEVDIKTSVLILDAGLGSIIYWMNSYSSLVTAALYAGATGVPANTTVPVPLTGGSEGGAITIEDWQVAFDAFMATEVNYMYPVSPDSAVHYLGKVHVEAASTLVERKYRMLFVGGSTDLDDDAAVAAASALSNELVVFAYPGITRRNLLTGVVEDLGGMSLAAILVGMTGGLPVGEPITNKQIDILATQKEFTTSDMIRLSQAGLCIPRRQEDTGAFVVLRDATTHVIDANTVLRRISGVEAVHEISRRLINGLRMWIGRKGNILTIAGIKGTIITILDLMTVRPTSPDGLLTEGRTADGTILPAFGNLSVTYDGQVVAGAMVDVRLVGEIELITLDVRAIPAEIVL